MIAGRGSSYGSGAIGAGRGKHDYVDDAAGARGVHVRATINDNWRLRPGGVLFVDHDGGRPRLCYLTGAIVFIPVSAPIAAHLGSGVCQSKMFPP